MLKFYVEDANASLLSKIIKKGLSLGLTLVDTWVEPGSGWFSSDKVFLKFSGRDSNLIAMTKAVRELVG